ncbi:hypothetical protein [Xanthomonas campestris]|uniref:hypothetical protein n=2 Tax=Xanthomonas TaxID=338 RepID=UPI003CCFE4BB
MSVPGARAAVGRSRWVLAAVLAVAALVVAWCMHGAANSAGRAAAVVAVPAAVKVAAGAPVRHATSGDLFDTAMQALACTERLQQRRAQIARGATAQPAQVLCTAMPPEQVDALLRTAAARGDLAAQRYLLAQRAAQMMQATAATTPAGQQARLAPNDEREMASIVSALELLALQGQPDAIESLAQVVASPLLRAPDSVYAAAWRLAARQPAGSSHDASTALQGEEELLDGLSEQQGAQARTLAWEIFDACCRRAADDAPNRGAIAQPK